MKCPKCLFDNPDESRFCGNCAAPLIPPEEGSVSSTETLETPTEELTRGIIFAGRYEVIEELGKGGMGKVYRVEDKKIKEEVALKLLKPEIALDKKTIERFSSELRTARMISHRNVCRMFDLGEERGTHYITMEYVPGEDLGSFIRRIGQLPVGKALSIAKQVCEGLAEAHRLGVVHRDLKPSNIMIDREGNVRIMDFGIARSLRAKGLTGAGMMIGTPEYMSPEQAEAGEVDHRSDLYSLGVILYEMVTGKLPFEGGTPLSVAMKHKNEVPKDPGGLNPQIPEALSFLILKCMEKDKQKRYQESEELLSELSGIESGIPTIEREVPGKKPFPSKEIKERAAKIKWKKSILYGGAAVLLVLLVVLRIFLFPGRQRKLESIAVLPMANLSGDPEQEYFTDGITDALISGLAKISGFQRVISRQSVMQYKGSTKSMPEIGRELNVAAVIEGTVLLVGQRVRITAQLIDAKRDRHLWSDSYEHDLQDVLVLQSEVARAIVNEVRIVMTQEEKTLLANNRTVNPEAYQLYLKGNYFYNRWTEEALKKAIEYYEQAIDKDPDFALAHLGVAKSYRTLSDFGYSPREAYPKAKEAVLKALAIDNALVSAHVILGWIKMNFEWDWAGAESEFKKAVESSPGDSVTHVGYAFNSLYRGRFDKAIREIKRAHELDPLSLTINRDVGTVLFHARKYDQAKEVLLKTIELDPNFPFVHLYLGRIDVIKSMYEESLLEFQKEIKLSAGIPGVEAFAVLAYLGMGKRSKAREIIDDLEKRSKQTYIPPMLFAGAYFAFGDIDLGFNCLDKAYQQRDFWMQWIKVDPAFDSVRSDTRYKTMLKKMNLED
jgi:serine/threonine protein kinase/tetratricopeptide (TPR) repeat protein